MARRSATLGVTPVHVPHMSLAWLASRGSPSRQVVATSWSTGQRFYLTVPKRSIGARCYHVGFVPETLRFRLRAFTGGAVLATKDVVAPASGIVTVTWADDIDLLADTSYTISVFNTTNASYTTFGSSTETGLLPTSGLCYLGNGVVRTFGVYAIGDIAPSVTANTTFPVDVRLEGDP